MPYTLKPDNNVIGQCGCSVNKYYMPKHLQTAKHEREFQGRENIEGFRLIILNTNLVIIKSMHINVKKILIYNI